MLIGCLRSKVKNKFEIWYCHIVLKSSRRKIWQVWWIRSNSPHFYPPMLIYASTHQSFPRQILKFINLPKFSPTTVLHYAVFLGVVLSPTEGGKFLHNFISSRAGHVESTENKAEMKTLKNTTLLQNDGRKGRQEDYLPSAACRVVFWKCFAETFPLQCSFCDWRGGCKPKYSSPLKMLPPDVHKLCVHNRDLCWTKQSLSRRGKQRKRWSKF